MMRQSAVSSCAHACVDRSAGRRTLDFLEVFSGSGRLAAAAEARDLQTATYDLVNGQDSWSPAGGCRLAACSGVGLVAQACSTTHSCLQAWRMQALQLLVAVRPGGCMWLAPPCSSWAPWPKRRTGAYCRLVAMLSLRNCPRAYCLLGAGVVVPCLDWADEVAAWRPPQPSRTRGKQERGSDCAAAASCAPPWSALRGGAACHVPSVRVGPCRQRLARDRRRMS